MRAASRDSQGRNLASREAGIFGLQPGEDVKGKRMMKTTEKTKQAQRKAALALADKLEAATDATNAFLRACMNADEPGLGQDDSRIILIGNMAEYAAHLRSVYGDKSPA